MPRPGASCRCPSQSLSSPESASPPTSVPAISCLPSPSSRAPSHSPSSTSTGNFHLGLSESHVKFRWRIRKRRLTKKLARLKAAKADEEAGEDIMVCPEPDFRLERRPSFPEEEDEEELLVVGVSFHNVEEGLEMCDLEYEMCEEMEDQMQRGGQLPLAG